MALGHCMTTRRRSQRALLSSMRCGCSVLQAKERPSRLVTEQARKVCCYCVYDEAHDSLPTRPSPDTPARLQYAWQGVLRLIVCGLVPLCRVVKQRLLLCVFGDFGLGVGAG